MQIDIYLKFIGNFQGPQDGIWNRLQRHPMLPHVAISKQTK